MAMVRASMSVSCHRCLRLSHGVTVLPALSATPVLRPSANDLHSLVLRLQLTNLQAQHLCGAAIVWTYSCDLPFPSVHNSPVACCPIVVAPMFAVPPVGIGHSQPGAGDSDRPALGSQQLASPRFGPAASRAAAARTRWHCASGQHAGASHIALHADGLALLWIYSAMQGLACCASTATQGYHSRIRRPEHIAATGDHSF